MTVERRRTPAEWPCASASWAATARDISVMAWLRNEKRGCDAFEEKRTSHPKWGRELHILVVGSLEQVGGDQNDGLVAEILPPMRHGARFGDDIAGLVRDGHGAVRRVFGDLAVDDVDDCGPVAMAMPRHD